VLFRSERFPCKVSGVFPGDVSSDSATNGIGVVASLPGVRPVSGANQRSNGIHLLFEWV
jgi:hypothetical protein